MVSATAGPAWTVSKAAKGAAPKRWDGAAWPKAKRTDRTFNRKLKFISFFLTSLIQNSFNLSQSSHQQPHNFLSFYKSYQELCHLNLTAITGQSELCLITKIYKDLYKVRSTLANHYREVKKIVKSALKVKETKDLELHFFSQNR